MIGVTARRSPLLTLLACAFACGFSGLAYTGEHDHGEHDVHGHGKMTTLGEVKLGNIPVEVIVHGKIEAGHEAVVTIVPEGKGLPNELRAWIGAKNGRGSVKALLKKSKKGGYHGHLEVPAKLTEASAFWMEIQGEDGRVRAMVALKNGDADHHPEEHKAEKGHKDSHDEHKGHDH